MSDMVLVPVEPTPAMLMAFNRVAEWLKTNEGTRYAVAAAIDGATGECGKPGYWKEATLAQKFSELEAQYPEDD